MPDDKPPQITLTVFLIKEDRVDLDSFLPDNESLDKYTIKNGREIIGDLYVKLSRAKPPGWGKFFADYIDAKDLGKASSTGAVLVVRVSERWFEVTSCLPEECRELVPKEAELKEVDDEFIHECIGTVKGIIVKTKGTGASLEDQFDSKKPKPLRTFLCGGGGRARLYSRLVKEVERSVKRNFHVGDLQVESLPHPATLHATGIAESDFHRLAVAYGLSLPHFDLGRVIPPSEIENMERRFESPNLPEPVTKDQV